MKICYYIKLQMNFSYENHAIKVIVCCCRYNFTYNGREYSLFAEIRNGRPSLNNLW